ncbi:SGNH/GDSL hydrolase family protein [Embleya sp. NPDC020886]|uniref:SGNH/GDSL hydrolase family protein n=1 Tax=Embleya sp. NPDC020886 TaxID=3363980 RepID=UPI0037AA2194
MRQPEYRVSHLRARILAAGLSALAAAALVPSTASGIAEHRYEWVALGDSYTAGLFIGSPLPALGDPTRDGCDRTTGSYPDLVAKALAANPPDRPVRLTDVSCDNATVDEIASTGQTPVSVVDPPAGGWPALDPQIRRAGLDERTDVVTIGIGANGLPFGGCLQRALSGKSCRDHYTNPPQGQDSLATMLTRLDREYSRMLDAVHKAAPHARVITIGYPALLPEHGTDCDRADLTHIGPITPADVDWLREDVLEPLNETIHRVASHHHDHYIDLYTAGIGHDACRPPGTKWIEGLCGDAADFWPSAFPGALPFDCAEIDKRATLVHPNAKAHTHTALHLEPALRHALRENTDDHGDTEHPTGGTTDTGHTGA